MIGIPKLMERIAGTYHIAKITIMYIFEMRALLLAEMKHKLSTHRLPPSRSFLCLYYVTFYSGFELSIKSVLDLRSQPLQPDLLQRFNERAPLKGLCVLSAFAPLLQDLAIDGCGVTL